MKKQTGAMLFLWLVIVVAVAGGTFFLCRHLGVGINLRPAMVATPDVNGVGGMDADVQENSSAGGADIATNTLRVFSAEGYSFRVPTTWRIDRPGADTAVVYPEAASSGAACKIEISAFPYSKGNTVADWIAHRIGADPSLAIVERSSENVSLGDGAAAVQWNGTIDDVPTTLVYAFNDNRAYEIAPSVVDDGADRAASCGDMLQDLLSTFTLQ